MKKYEVIPEEIQKDYLRRLKTPYKKKGISKSFFDQFNKASGQEIKDGKFWSIISSSRLCFDLYSWMAEDDSYEDIEVEKQLTGLNAGGSPPNMDAYETASEIIFIESKYTELVRKFIIPEAYWVETDAYHTTKGKLTEKPILDRYRGRSDVKDKFVSLIKYVRERERKRKGATWFDSKQEICHLLGIVFYLLENKPQKRVHFFNVAANYSDNDLDLAIDFCIRAEEMIREILSANSVSTLFDYQLCSVKKFFGSFLLLDRKGYETSKTVRELISDPELYALSKHPIR